MTQSKEATKIVGICWVDADTFWWNATDQPTCPACAPSDPGYTDNHALYLEADIAQALDDMVVWLQQHYPQVLDELPTPIYHRIRFGHYHQPSGDVGEPAVTGPAPQNEDLV